jgi:hypothetical protein
VSVQPPLCRWRQTRGNIGTVGLARRCCPTTIIHTNRQTDRQTDAHTHRHARAHTHTHTDTHTHTLTHSHTRTHQSSLPNHELTHTLALWSHRANGIVEATTAGAAMSLMALVLADKAVGGHVVDLGLLRSLGSFLVQMQQRNGLFYHKVLLYPQPDAVPPCVQYRMCSLTLECVLLL